MALLPRTTLEEAIVLAEQLRVALGELDLGLGCPETRVTGSFGVAECLSGETWDGVCSRCDHSLYAAKACGGNAVHGCNPVDPAPLGEIFVAIP